jgi:hypothetical protein
VTGVRVLVSVLVAATAACVALAEPATSAKQRTTPQPLWGIAGGYQDGDYAALAARGVDVVLLELRWAEAEPVEGRWNEPYFESVRRNIRLARSAGRRIVLNFGLHEAPDWLLARPGARFVDQHGRVFEGDRAANLVFATGLRPYAERYVKHVFAKLGRKFLAVRVGGLHLGELTYPYEGRGSNSYWAFDQAATAARAKAGLAGYVPCTGGRDQARTFLTWYTRALVRFQNWQVRTVRRSFSGSIAVVYPGWGVRPGDAARAAATNLCGTSSPEINGEIQRGTNHRAQILGLPKDRCLAVWGTYADNAGHVAELANLATRRGFAKVGENSGESTDDAAMARSTENARRFKLDLFLWVRLYDRGASSLDRWSNSIRATSRPAPMTRSRSSLCRG